MTPKEHLYGALIAIRHDLEAWDGGDDSFEPVGGICTWAYNNMSGHRLKKATGEYLRRKMEEWPGGTGSGLSPVPADDQFVSQVAASWGPPWDQRVRVRYATRQFNHTTGPQKWDPRTPYGRARRALLAWLIEQMEQEDLSV